MNFSSPGTAADHDLRKAKASAMLLKKRREHEAGDDTQGRVWSHINVRLMDAENGCNGMAVVSGGKIQSIDIFGTEKVYKYYFRLLRDAAFRIARQGRDVRKADKHESFYRVLEAPDTLETAEKNPEESYSGAGKMFVCEKDDLIGFELTIEGQPVHTSVFNRHDN